MDSRRDKLKNSRRESCGSGSKDGVGKSMTTLATLDYVVSEGSVLLVECDHADPGCVSRARELVPTERTDFG
jgi:hypothetical protein